MKKNFFEILKIFMAIFSFIFLASLVYYFIEPKSKTIKKENLSHFITSIKNANIYKAVFVGNNVVNYTTYDNIEHTVDIPISIQKNILKSLCVHCKNVEYLCKNSSYGKRNKWIDMIIDIMVFIGFMFLMRSQGGGVGSFSKTNKKTIIAKTNVNFSDVKGVDSIKQEVMEVVDFIKNPHIFLKKGLSLPKGILFYGPPGTGKTYLAKAIANEAKVNFISACGSSFIEVFAGVGPARVRELFDIAKKNSPCIIFIDEIDGIGVKRGNIHSSQEGHNTLTALLEKMDGFDENEQILVIGATNLVDNLDPALKRPGRFDKIIHVPLPDINGRIDILYFYLSKIKIKYDFDISAIGKMTINFSGADLKNLINEAMFIVLKNREDILLLSHMEQALEKIWFGIPNKRKYSNEDKLLTAFHEIGHTIAAYLLKENTDPIHKVTIVNHGNALGFLAQLPDKEPISINKTQIKTKILIALAGRASEELFFGIDKITSGAVSDFKAATRYANNMVAFWGMSEEQGKYFLDENYQAIFSEDMKNITYNTAKKILDDSYKEIMLLLEKNKEIIFRLVYFLIQKETLYKEDIENIINNNLEYVGETSSILIKNNNNCLFENNSFKL